MVRTHALPPLCVVSCAALTLVVGSCADNRSSLNDGSAGSDERNEGSTNASRQAARDAGIEVGRDYAMDICHAERHSGESNFRIETTIDCITPVLVI